MLFCLKTTLSVFVWAESSVFFRCYNMVKFITFKILTLLYPLYSYETLTLFILCINRQQQRVLLVRRSNCVLISRDTHIIYQNQVKSFVPYNLIRKSRKMNTSIYTIRTCCLQNKPLFLIYSTFEEIYIHIKRYKMKKKKLRC